MIDLRKSADITAHYDRPLWKRLAMRFDAVRAVAAFPGPKGLLLINVLFQRILGINGSVPFMVHFTSRVSGKVEIGRDVWQSFALSGGCYVQGINGVYIDDETIFAPGVKIISANHDLTAGGWLSSAPIRIGKRCWLGANVVILPAVELGDGVIVAAGAVVTRSFPDGSVIAGVPARVKRVVAADGADPR